MHVLYPTLLPGMTGNQLAYSPVFNPQDLASRKTAARSAPLKSSRPRARWSNSARDEANAVVSARSSRFGVTRGSTSLRDPVRHTRSHARYFFSTSAISEKLHLTKVRSTE